MMYNVGRDCCPKASVIEACLILISYQFSAVFVVTTNPCVIYLNLHHADSSIVCQYSLAISLMGYAFIKEAHRLRRDAYSSTRLSSVWLNRA